MQDISVKRYKHPKRHGWAGWMEPQDKSWIVFVGTDGRPIIFLNRDPVSGCILDDDPEQARKDLEHTENLGNIGRPYDGKADWGEAPSPLEVGETVFPLGEDGTGGKGI